ncbi:hypothetical protein [Bradyrhizobium amphicarpaeae]|nr:hypothetical protein [Bradyrhizobium amphicarpaeae]
MQRAGIIHHSHGRIGIVDRQALETTSCDCYSAVNAYHLRLAGAEP